MNNALRPASALLAALALWSLGLLMLAVAGLGGRVGLHPGNAALMPALPAVRLETGGSRLGPALDYLAVGNRPLLSADRRPVPMTDSAGPEQEPFEAELTSVLLVGELRMAMLQDRKDGRSRRVRLGEQVEGTAWRLVELQPRRAVFEGPEGRRELALRVFDGSGGVPPTAQAGLRPSAPAAGAVAATGASPTGAATVPEQGADAAAAGSPPAVAPVTPEEQVEAIRRRIEARRAMRAAEAAAEQAAQERTNR
ncbi:MAG: general secretion pathway protein GspN [Arenimonas sp.]|nr:general secretion pathway protein GspN [Arenimonas sp.]